MRMSGNGNQNARASSSGAIYLRVSGSGGPRHRSSLNFVPASTNVTLMNMMNGNNVGNRNGPIVTFAYRYELPYSQFSAIIESRQSLIFPMILTATKGRGYFWMFELRPNLAANTWVPHVTLTSAFKPLVHIACRIELIRSCSSQQREYVRAIWLGDRGAMKPIAETETIHAEDAGFQDFNDASTVADEEFVTFELRMYLDKSAFEKMKGPEKITFGQTRLDGDSSTESNEVAGPSASKKPRLSGEREGSLQQLHQQWFEEVANNQTRHSDVKILAKDGRAFSAHWLVLEQCEPFRSMYDSGMQEAQTAKINMEEFDAWIVLELLRYFYVGEVQNIGDLSSAEQLFYAADMFMISDVKAFCESVLLSHVNWQNACRLLQVSERANSDALRRQCLNAILTEIGNVKLSCPEFAELEARYHFCAKPETEAHRAFYDRSAL